MDLKLIAGNANPALAEEISDCLGTPLCATEVTRFPDGETFVHIEENIRGADVFVIQPTCPPVNENLMELLIIIDAVKRASAERVAAVIPYYGYGRQDRKHTGRVPISAKLVANLIETAGADRVLTLDLHAGQIQGFFDIPVDNLMVDPIFIRYFRREGIAEGRAVIVSPDLGAVKRARAIAEGLQLPLAIIEKRRVTSERVESLNLIGEVRGRRAIIVDDIISTGGTVLETVELLQREGVREIYAAFTHGIFAGDALERLRASPIKRIVVTNSIPPPDDGAGIIERIPVGELFAEVIARIHENRSVSEVFPHL
ncbi:MAG: ribose-phosphate pyrophosphokinase [Candidatus Acetothermia bacterium]|jgi:ribose-phosphate pyrophosphokinase|nr:ribose-phosphate pyrophosphokinase [Candidatus Acetothermia bacterium]MDH7506107.1 ribose-phosphate pyrophosphokinase [Candidatus Acetothermia bacterium]